MSATVLVNGAAPDDALHAIAVSDRGLNYGDGLFETTLVANGRVRFLEDHLERLAAGCERLRIALPDMDALRSEIDSVGKSADCAVLKIIVTRGIATRGYRPDAQSRPTRIVALHAAPAVTQDPIELRWCETRLARNARLAGIKHLNRLEQVLAQSEWDDDRIAEGLLLDTEGELVSATASNVFVVRDNLLLTPDLRFAGVRGVMRLQVLRAARRLGLPTSEEPLWPQDIESASEVFVTNAVRGIRSAGALGPLRWSAGPVADKLRQAVGC